MLFKTETPLARVLDRLEKVEQYDGYHKSNCPNHEDCEPVLTITEQDDNTVFLYCHDGCTQEAIVEALELSMSDISESNLASMSAVDAVDTVDAVLEQLPEESDFPVEVLPSACRTLAKEAADAIGCPVAFVGVPMLAILGAAIGNSRVLKIKEGWQETASIYSMLVADPDLTPFSVPATTRVRLSILAPS